VWNRHAHLTTRMKYWLITFGASVAWVALDLGIMYLHTRAQNDALDEKYGQVAGVGFVVIWLLPFSCG